MANGFKVFTVGEVLTAADVNDYLMEQSISIFADSTARDAQITSPIEGMFCYLADSNVLQYFDGSAWGSYIGEGDISAVNAGNGLSGGGTSGSVTLALDANELSAATAEATDYVVIEDVTDNSTKKALISDIIDQGDITGVTAGDGLSGGGTSGDVSLALDLNELTAATVDVANDSVAIIDATDNSSKKETISDIVTGVSGTGLAASGGQLSVDINSQTSVTAATGDEILIADVSDSNNIKKVTAQSILDLGGGQSAWTVLDFWGMNGDRSGTGTVTAWTDVSNNTGRHNIGSSMSQSSGTFTFPETGYYLVELWSYIDGTDLAEIHCDILGTTNNSSYVRIGRSSIQYNEDFGGHRQMPYVSTVFDVSSTTNCKIRFQYNGNFRTYTRVRGNGTTDETQARFTKVADT